MTSDEFKAARHTLGLSVDELSFVINTNDRTIRRWEDGTRSPNPVAARVMEWMLAGFEPPQWPDGKGSDSPLRRDLLSVRAFNALTLHGIKSEGNLRRYYERYGEAGLRRIRFFGDKTVREVVEYLNRPEPDEWKGE